MSAPALHPDLVRIRQVIEDSDERARQATGADDEDMVALHQGLVDFDSLFCASTDRARQALADVTLGMMLQRPDAVLGATWADGFLAGVRYAQLAAEEGS